jgi:hypothetical protein
LIAISVTPAAYKAIAADGDVAQAPQVGNRRIWLDRRYVDRPKAMRGPGKSYSDVILRLAAE